MQDPLPIWLGVGGTPGSFARAGLGLSKAGQERGWGRVTRAHFDAERGPHGAMILGGADEVIDKIHHYDEVLGGVSRPTFQMDLAALPHAKLMRAIETIGTFVAPAVREQSAAAASI